jgi:two-component system sensor kinase FixL
MSRERNARTPRGAAPPSNVASLERRKRTLARAVLQAAPGATLIHDADGRLAEVNASACTLLRYTRETLLNTGLDAIRDPEPLSQSTSTLTTLEAGQSVVTSWRCHRSDGTAFTADVHSVRLPLPGRPRYASYLNQRAADASATRATELRLSKFLDESPSVCFQKDVAGRYEFVNRRFAELFKISLDRVVGKTDYDLFPAAIADAVSANDRQVADSGCLLIIEESVPSDGGVRRYLSHKFPIRDAAGRTVGVAGIATDITAHKQAEDRLRVRDRQLNVFFDNNPAMCFQKDLEGRYEFVNGECAQVFGMDAADSIGKVDGDLFPEASALEFRDSDRRVLATGAIVVIEQEVPGPRGPRWFQTHKFPIRGDDDRIIGIAGIGTEITELKHAESRTRAGERRYRNLVELAPDGVLVIRDGHIALANSAAVRLFGASGAAALIGTSYSGHFDAAGAVPVRDLNAQVLAGAQAPPLVDVRIVAPDGTNRTVEVSAAHFDDAEGTAVQVIIRDQTDRRRLERSLVEVTEQERRRFGADLHDDLGQWLTAAALMLGSYQTTIEKAGGDGAPAARIRDVIVGALERTRSLARGFAPDLERGGLEPALAALARSCADRFKIACQFEGADAATAGLSPQVAMQLYRIAQEATTNVARHAHAHHIRILLRRDPAQVSLRIEDDGEGFAAGTARAVEGMGIRSMRYRAGLLGGTLTVSSTTGGGTMIECVCPLSMVSRLTPSRAELAGRC